LCDAVILAELDGTLSNGTWTVFAPTDDAFLELLQREDSARNDSLELLQNLLLQNLLLFHVVSGYFFVDDLACSGLLEMVRTTK
jgi:uncharacterized surface protein with fasciclin (FAS1) repeats